MAGKINLGGLIRAHVKTLKNYNSGRYRPLDFVTFYGLPLVVAAALAWAGAEAGTGLAGAVATAAPLTALVLSTVVGTVYKVAYRVHKERSSRTVARQFSAELVTNIFYAIAVSVLTTAAAVASLLSAGGRAKGPADFALFWLATHLGLTTLMALTRARVLIGKHCEEEEEDAG